MRQIVNYQIGDWIMVEGRPVQIAAIHQKKVGYHRWEGRLSWVRLDKIIPIPLTPDLLLKNGFVKKNGSYTFGSQTFGINLRDSLDGVWEMDIWSGIDMNKHQVKSLKIHHVQHEFIAEGIKKDFII